MTAHSEDRRKVSHWCLVEVLLSHTTKSTSELNSPTDSPVSFQVLGSGKSLIANVALFDCQYELQGMKTVSHETWRSGEIYLQPTRSRDLVCS